MSTSPIDNQLNAYNAVDLEDIVPTCPHCSLHTRGNKLPVLVGSFIGPGTSKSTPIWHCPECSHAFSGHSSEMEAVLRNNGLNTYTSSPGMLQNLDVHQFTNQGMSLQEYIKREALQSVRNEWGYNLEQAQLVIEGDQSFKDLKYRVEDLEAREIKRSADPMWDLRERVAKFKL